MPSGYDWTDDRDYILDEMESFTHRTVNRDGKTVVEPWYFMMSVLMDSYGLNENEVRKLAEDNGYIVLLLPKVGSFDGGPAIADSNVDLDKVRKSIEDFVADELLEVPEIDIKVVTKKPTAKVSSDEAEQEDAVEGMERDFHMPAINARAVGRDELSEVSSHLDHIGLRSRIDGYDITAESVSGGHDEESFMSVADRVNTILEAFEANTGCPADMRAGLTADGHIKCNIKIGEGVSNTLRLFHGSQSKDLKFKPDYPLYLTDDKDFARQFADGYAFGNHLLDTDYPTVYEFEVTLNNPYEIKDEDEYERLMDITNYEQAVPELSAKGHDGMVYRAEGEPTYYMLFDPERQARLISKEPTETCRNMHDDLDEDIEKHDELNPALFDGNELKPDVIDAIKNIANTFVDELAEDGIALVVKDIILVGSNVSYNYTKDSDLDIHLIVDSKALDCPREIVDKLYGAYRSIFNKNYDITIKGIPAEIYVELDEMGSAKSNGVYSIENGWVKEPVQQDIPDLDSDAFDSMFSEWEDKYLELMDREDATSDDVRGFIEDIYDLRKNGIAEDGEYSIGNLVFKEFRNLGYLDGLKDWRKELKGKELSLEALNNGLRESLKANTPYMLRNDGRLLGCGSVHPYVRLYQEHGFEKSMKDLEDHPTFLDWFKENTLNDRTAELVDIAKSGKLDERGFNELNDLTNQEFCRVRTSNIKYAYGGDNGEIYFRISSNRFNWFDLIWKVVAENSDSIKFVTIVRDKPIVGNRQDYYRFGDKVSQHLPVDEFLTLKGNPVVEEIDHKDGPSRDTRYKELYDSLETGGTFELPSLDKSDRRNVYIIPKESENWDDGKPDEETFAKAFDRLYNKYAHDKSEDYVIGTYHSDESGRYSLDISFILDASDFTKAVGKIADDQEAIGYLDAKGGYSSLTNPKYKKKQ